MRQQGGKYKRIKYKFLHGNGSWKTENRSWKMNKTSLQYIEKE